MRQILQKTLLLLVLILTVIGTNFGQTIRPKRIVYRGDTGIFLTKRQEGEVLKKLALRNTYKSELDSMFKYSSDCTESLLLSREAFFGLFDNYKDLEEEAMNSALKNQNLESQLEQSQEKLAQEQKKKVRWRRATVSTGIVAVGAVTAVVTGVWLPALAVGAAVELGYLLTPKKEK
jgi:hypothetical protein